MEDLGLLYSNTLNFSENISKRVSIARSRVGLIQRNFKTLEFKKKIFISIIRPHLELSPMLFSTLRLCDKIKLESPQRLFTKKILYHLPELDYQARCSLLKLQPIWVRQFLLSTSFLHKLIHKKTYTTLDFFEFRTRVFGTRSYNCLTIRRAKSAKFRNFFTINSFLLWNDLPNELRLATNFYRFKRLLKLFINMSTFSDFSKKHGLRPL